MMPPRAVICQTCIPAPMTSKRTPKSIVRTAISICILSSLLVFSIVTAAIGCPQEGQFFAASDIFLPQAGQSASMGLAGESIFAVVAFSADVSGSGLVGGGDARGGVSSSTSKRFPHEGQRTSTPRRPSPKAWRDLQCGHIAQIILAWPFPRSPAPNPS